LFGLLKARTIEAPETCAQGANPYSRFGPDASRGIHEENLTRFEPNHVRRAASPSPVRSDRDFDRPAAPVAMTDPHASGPISVSVLRRALPQRFALIDGRQEHVTAEDADEFKFEFAQGAVV